MDRLNFYYKQLVAESDLDDAFDKAEAADRNIVKDNALWGVNSGGAVTKQGAPDLTVAIAAFVGYSKGGERLYTAGSTTVDVSQDVSSVSTAVATVGHSRWISIFAIPGRDYTDARTDGNGDPVYYDAAEAVTFRVVMGASGASPTRPAVIADGILIADISRAYGQTTIVNANIYTDRRETLIFDNQNTHTLAAGSIQDAFSQILVWWNDHITGADDRHTADVVEYGGGSAWADGTTNAAADVETTLDSIFSGLSSTTTGSSGAKKIGAELVTGTPLALLAGTVQSQISGLVSGVNSLHALVVKLAGTQTITGAKTFDDLNISTANPIKYTSRNITRAEGTFGAQFDPSQWEHTPLSLGAYRLRSLVTTAGATVAIPIHPPHNSTLSAVSARLVPDTGVHANAPATMPTVALVRVQRTGGSNTLSIGSVTDPTNSSGAAYEAAHQVNLTGLSATIDRTTYDYYVVVTNESGANSHTHLGVQGVTWTVAVTEQSIG